MIGILSNRLTDDFVDGLKIPYEFIIDFNPEEEKKYNGLFIDWVPEKSNEVACLKQATLLHKYLKWGIPIVIFDRSMSMTEKEVEWCKKFNTYLFEPCLNSNREGFNYLPEWIDYLEILIDDEDRKFDVVYEGKLNHQIEEFEKWIKKYANFFYKKKVVCNLPFLPDFKIKEFNKSNLILKKSSPLYNEGNFTVALDSNYAYKIGYLNPFNFYAMNLGCLPLLPTEHKYFHSLFKGLIVENIKEMDFYVSSFSRFKNELIEEIFDRIKLYWSEFTLSHAIDVIKNCYKS